MTFWFLNQYFDFEFILSMIAVSQDDRDINRLLN